MYDVSAAVIGNEAFPDTFKQAFRAFYDDIQTGDFNGPAPLRPLRMVIARWCFVRLFSRVPKRAAG